MAAGVTVRPKQRPFGPRFHRAVAKGLAAVGTTLVVLAQREVNTSNLRGENPSKPGEPPHKGTGFGQRGIVHDHDPRQPVSRVGWTRAADYMFFHERGIRYSRVGLQKREHVQRAMRRGKARLATAFNKGFAVGFA